MTMIDGGVGGGGVNGCDDGGNFLISYLSGHQRTKLSFRLINSGNKRTKK